MRASPFPPLSSVGLPAWLGTLASAAALSATAAWWGLQLLSPAAPIAPAATVGGLQAPPELRMASQAFGTPAGPQGPVQATDASITVHGVLASDHRPSAILSVDGQPPRAYALDEPITPTQRLLAVGADTVLIGSPERSIELAAPVRPSLAMLSAGPERGPGLPAGFDDAGTEPRVARPLGASSGVARPAAPAAFSQARPATLPTLPGGARLPMVPGGARSAPGGQVALPAVPRPSPRND